jgi:predicted Zn-dependent protease
MHLPNSAWAIVAVALSCAAPAHAADRSERFRQQDARVARVSDRLATAGEALCRQMSAREGCSSVVELVPDAVVNAWADGKRVMITTAIVEQCRSDDELAIVIGHELSHNILDHRRRLAAAGVEMGLLPTSAAGSATMRATEEEADGLAVRMAGAAGYDLAQAAPFLGRLLGATGLRGRSAATHPAAVRRLALLTEAVARVRR